MHISFVTTWLLYFVFAMGMYVADLWGITTWLSNNASEAAAFTIFLVLAIGMATSLSIFKHVFYQHRAEFAYGMTAVIIVACVGVFFEAVNSSSQQQNIAYGKAESSRAFESVAGTSVNVGQTNTGQLALYQGELARYRSLDSTCKKNCTATHAKVAEFRAKVAAEQDANTAAAANVATATTSAIKAKAETMQAMKDDQHKPIFKSVRDLFGVTIATAIMLITLVVSGAFEYCHALLSRILGEKLAMAAALREQLIRQTTDYMQSTGKEYDRADFSGLGLNFSHTPTAKDGAPKKDRPGFGFIPNGAPSASNGGKHRHPCPVQVSGTGRRRATKTPAVRFCADWRRIHRARTRTPTARCITAGCRGSGEPDRKWGARTGKKSFECTSL